MKAAYLLIGGNMGDRLANITAARVAIHEKCGEVKASSFIYETAAWGLEEQPHFLNQALKIHTSLQAATLLQCLLDIEKALGRVREIKYGPRLIDIDILLYEDAIINETGLKVPHPELPNRRFALKCLADIAANNIHPVLKKPIQHLLLECTDHLEVHKFS